MDWFWISNARVELLNDINRGSLTEFWDLLKSSSLPKALALKICLGMCLDHTALCTRAFHSLWSRGTSVTFLQEVYPWYFHKLGTNALFLGACCSDKNCGIWVRFCIKCKQCFKGQFPGINSSGILIKMATHINILRVWMQYSYPYTLKSVHESSIQKEKNHFCLEVSDFFSRLLNSLWTSSLKRARFEEKSDQPHGGANSALQKKNM